MLGPCLLFSTLCHYSIAIILMGKRELVAFLVFLTLCDCTCSVALPRADVGWSAVCYCGII